MDSLVIYFTDPVLRAPTIGSMLMCLAAALVGVIIFLRKQSLVGESLSHASYPGVMIGVILAGALSISENEEWVIALFILSGAFLTALLGLWTITWMERRLKIRSDSALCFVLSAFFGVGLTLASEIQFTHTLLYRQVQAYLFGQAATMTDIHVLIYGLLAAVILAMVILLYKELQMIAFDRSYAKSVGVPTRLIDGIIFVLITLAIVVGIRSVGVVLMSAMLIAPAAAARQFTNKLYVMFSLAAFFGLLSGFFGNYTSLELTRYLSTVYPTARLALPTGPMIVMMATAICVLALLFAPERGLFVRLFRIGRFRYRCVCENVLKSIWRHHPTKEITFTQIETDQAVSPWYLRFVLWRLVRNGWLEKVSAGSYRLTHDGSNWAARIVRLHRLWEVYLAEYVGVGAERVHRSAEEMEHIITPELEHDLALLLKDPKRDPHQQPIPPSDNYI